MMSNLKNVITYLDNLEVKEKFMLISSIFIVGVITYFYLNMPLFKTIERNNDKIASLKLSMTEKYINEAKEIKQKVLNMKKKVKEKQDDLRYLKMFVLSEPFFYIDKYHFSNILHILLSSKNNLYPSYTIDIKEDDFKKYIITISGYSLSYNLKNFYNFLKDIETIKYIKKVSNVKLTPTNVGYNFSLKVEFWSLK